MSANGCQATDQFEKLKTSKVEMCFERSIADPKLPMSKKTFLLELSWYASLYYFNGYDPFSLNTAITRHKRTSHTLQKEMKYPY